MPLLALSLMPSYRIVALGGAEGAEAVFATAINKRGEVSMRVRYRLLVKDAQGMPTFGTTVVTLGEMVGSLTWANRRRRRSENAGAQSQSR